MSITNIIAWIIIGALAGWLANSIMKTNTTFLKNVIIGIVGSFLGGWVASLVGIQVSGPFSIGGFAVAIIGACLLIFIGGKLFK